MKKNLNLLLLKYYYLFYFILSCHLIDGVVSVKVIKFEHSNQKITNFNTIKGTELLKNQQRVG